MALTYPGAPDLSQGGIQKHQQIIAMIFAFSLLWGLAGNVIGSKANEIDTLIRNIMDECADARVGFLSFPLPFFALAPSQPGSVVLFR